MEKLQQYLENKFMMNIINIMKNNTDLTENQKHQIISIFKQKYSHELISIYDCETSLTEIYNNFNIWREPGNIVLTPRFVKEFYREWQNYLETKNKADYNIAGNNNWEN